MKRHIVAILGIILVSLGMWGLISWLNNGGWPSSGPTGSLMPPHIHQVSPSDGEKIVDAKGFCVEFFFQSGSGMGHQPEKTIRYYLDGRNVTKGVHGLVTLDYPPSGGSYCYGREDKLSPGWHTAKVTYIDSEKQRFSYSWRFHVIESH